MLVEPSGLEAKNTEGYSTRSRAYTILGPLRSWSGKLSQAHSLKHSRINILVCVFGGFLDYHICHL